MWTRALRRIVLPPLFAPGTHPGSLNRFERLPSLATAIKPPRANGRTRNPLLTPHRQSLGRAFAGRLRGVIAVVRWPASQQAAGSLNSTRTLQPVPITAFVSGEDSMAGRGLSRPATGVRSAPQEPCSPHSAYGAYNGTNIRHSAANRTRCAD